MSLQSIKIDCPKTNTCFGEILYPGLTIGVKLASGAYQPIEFILDSGADITTVPRSLSQLVGFSLPSDPDTFLTDASGGRTPCFKGRLHLQLQDIYFEIRCLFSDSDQTPFLLGRLDFFSLFNIYIHGSNCHIILEKIVP